MKYVYLLFLFSIISCNKEKTRKNGNSTHPELIGVDILIAPNSSDYKVYEKKMFHDPFEYIYKKDTVYVNFYRILDNCTHARGKIIVMRDTIKLSIKQIGKCGLGAVRKVRFKIRNPKNKKYIIWVE